MKDNISRRSFLRYSLCTAASLCLAGNNNSEADSTKVTAKEARFYTRVSPDIVKCNLCFRECTITEGRRGFCRNRENTKGMLYSLVFARAGAIHLDPIEKEPMFHNRPNTDILCTGTAGCNFQCKFCHNWHLSQRTPEELSPVVRNIQPEEIVDIAKKMGSGLSFTYNEPTVFYEFMYDTAMLGKKNGLNVICHTNGGMKPEPLSALLKHLDGVTVDLKGFTADYYRDASFSEMKPVLDTLKLIKAKGIWLEIVNLVIPTLNDDLNNIKKMCKWIRGNLGEETPVHFTRFSPSYKMTHLPPTPVRSLENAWETAVSEGLHYVYIGNVPGHRQNSTFCPKCRKKIIDRTHFSVESIDIVKDKCKYCSHPIPGIWKT